ncbi:hypothetical protein ENBRE01_2054 [Enteropsectra breve]|nr:hypothetical protein ENBRE01_2054 [Enteropsectra breve]
MVWACFSFFKLSKIVFVDGTLNSNSYQNILEEYLISFIDELDSQNILFQQDNARPHVSISTKSWLEERGVECMDWPPYSPDLNPIENLWGILAQQVYPKGRQYENEEELKASIKKEWQEFEITIAHTPVYSMRNRFMMSLLKMGLTQSIK